MATDTRIEDLELSVRTMGLLQTHGFTTVGDLLTAAFEVPTVVAAELRAVLGELGHELPETIRVAGAHVKVLEATGDIATRWATIEAWLADHNLELVAGFRPPADAVAIEAAEKALERQLPADYRQFLALHDGQNEGAPMIGTCSLFAVRNVASAWQRRARLFDPDDPPPSADQVAPGIRAVSYSAGWIPIGQSSRGRDYLCLDLDPGDGGAVGQVIQIAIDFNDRQLVAPSFTEMLSVYFAGMQTGDIEIGDA